MIDLKAIKIRRTMYPGQTGDCPMRRNANTERSPLPLSIGRVTVGRGAGIQIAAAPIHSIGVLVNPT